MASCKDYCHPQRLLPSSKIIAILKDYCHPQTGLDPDEAISYRPISLLSVGYKLLERLIYNRLLPVFGPLLPRE